VIATTDIYKAADLVMHIVKTSELNVACSSVLNHSGFITSNPLFDKLTGKLHTNAKAMSENVGSLHMALLAQAGIAYFDLGKYTRHYKCHPSGNKKETDEDTTGSKLYAVLKHLQSTIDIPTVESLQPFIKEAFSSLDNNKFYLLQSFLHELYVLQPWTQPLSYKEDQEKSKLVSIPGSTKQVITKEVEDDNDGMDWSTFATFSDVLPQQSIATDETGKKQKITVQKNNSKPFLSNSKRSDKTQLDNNSRPPQKRKKNGNLQSKGSTAMSTPTNREILSSSFDKTVRSSKKKGTLANSLTFVSTLTVFKHNTLFSSFIA